jgi:DNA-directed RNA polymerase specialized sigma24 family protein
VIPKTVAPNLIDLNSLESIVDWFDQRKKSFYILGLSYLTNQQQIEEAFYQTIIKVHKELPRYNVALLSFDTWMTSIFISVCRDLTQDRGLPDPTLKGMEIRQDFFKGLDQLNDAEKNAVVLTYVKGISMEEATQVLRVSMGELKEILFNGIRTLRRKWGYGDIFYGCKEFHSHYIDYLEGAMNRPIKVEFEVHIYHCQNCQTDLATFQDVMLSLKNLHHRFEELHVPPGIMDKVEERLAEMETKRQQRSKKRKKMGLVSTSIFAVVIALSFFTGILPNFYFTMLEEDDELIAFLKQDLGDRLNLVSESNGVKIKIKTAIADDIQTLILYEIEDTKGNYKYIMDYHDGVNVENSNEIFSNVGNPMYYAPDLLSNANKNEKNVYKGKMSLPPLKGEKGTINLKVSRIQKLVHSKENEYQHIGVEAGDWNFEIPVTKKPSKEYVLAKKINIEEVPVRFDRLIMAPTATILQYGINVDPREKRLDVLNFGDLEVNNMKLKNDKFSRAFSDLQPDMNWHTFTIRFDPLYGEKPQEVNVNIESVNLMFDVQKTIELGELREYPFTFEYAGSTISVDSVEVGQPTTVVISNHEIEKREYEMLHFNILSGKQDETSSMEMNTEGVLLDKNGKKYDMNNIPVAYDKIEQPRHYVTVQTMKLHSNHPDEKIIPARLELYGYNSTKYLDEVVKILIEQ